MLKKILIGSSLAALSLASPALIAKNITLYDQPADTAKAIGKIDTETGFVPIFTQKDGKWVKVGDPDNGNTGWVKSSDLSDAANSSRGFSFSQSMVKQGNGSPSWVFRLGTPKPMTDKQMQQFFEQNRQQQEAIQRDVQNMMNTYFSTQPDWMGYPMILPLMVVPVQQNAVPQPPAMPSSATKK